jgi:hypothetical protein
MVPTCSAFHAVSALVLEVPASVVTGFVASEQLEREAGKDGSEEKAGGGECEHGGVEDGAVRHGK